ncbi:MAG: hypothetical protein ACI4XH_02445 [Acutalibacteraceae bacterium]
MWSDDSGRSMTGDSKGTLVGIFPKLQIKIGKQSASERAQLVSLLNQAAVTVRAFNVSKQRFEQASFYFGDVVNKIKKWDANGTLGTRNSTTGVQTYKCSATFDSISFSIIANSRRRE